MKIALIVDNPYRDLPGIVLTASYLCRRGAECWLVPSNLSEPEIWALAPDFVLMHNLRTVTQEFVRQLLKAGIEVGVLDTEGGVFTSLDAYADTMAPDTAVRHATGCFCSWGTRLAAHAIAQGWYRAEQVIVTGNPRFDYYTAPWRAAALQASPYAARLPGPLVLFNGNFPTANPKFKTAEEEVIMLAKRFGFPENQARRWQREQYETMVALAGLANRLAARWPEVSFVYRPHPFENKTTYDGLLESRNNLHLIKEGTVDGWILRSSAVIQRGCSTAIEAGLAGVPALSPVWIPTPFHMEAAEAVSIPCTSEEELTGHLEAALEGRLEPPAAVRESLTQVIGDWFYRNDGQSHQRVGDVILTTLQKSRRKVDTARCRNNAYGLGRRDLPTVARVAARLRRRLNLSPHWSFRQWRDVNASLTWDNTEKHFDAAAVNAILAAIGACEAAETGTTPGRIKARPARERGDYRFSYREGRTITVYAERNETGNVL